MQRKPEEWPYQAFLKLMSFSYSEKMKIIGHGIGFGEENHYISETLMREYLIDLIDIILVWNLSKGFWRTL